MTKRLALVWGSLFILLITYDALADSNEAVPVCSVAEAAQISRALTNSDFATSYGEMVEIMKDLDVDGGDLLTVMDTISHLQSDWWNDITTSFPNCAIAQEFTIIGGRMLDELLIGASMGQAGYQETKNGNDDGLDIIDRAKHHIAEWTDAQDNFIAIVSDLTEMAQK